MIDLRTVWLSSLLVVPIAAQPATQDKRPPKQQAEQEPAPQTAEAKRRVIEEFAKQKITLDLDAKTITIPVTVNQPADPIEYLLIHPRGKGHEALLVTEVLPSVLNSALLLLGYTKGENADLVEKNPAPTVEDIENGAEPYDLVPPKGKPLFMTVRWKEEKGEVHVPVSDLLVDLHTGQRVLDNQWIYLGGRMSPLYRGEDPVFVADYEGNIISVSYMRPANHLVTMRHERAFDDQNWWVTDRCPKVGTELQLVLHETEPMMVAERREKNAAAKKKADKNGGR